MQIKRWVKSALKIIGILLLVTIVIGSILFYRIFRPLSDTDIVNKFESETFQPSIKHIDFKHYKIRLIGMQEKIDTMLPTLIFVHGSPGSSMDFKSYLIDNELNKISNMLTYDRVGYGETNQGEVLNSVEEEVHLLHHITKDIDPSKLIFIGYSYGATVVLASPKNVSKKMILAGAIRGELEPMFWAINLYKWKLTRPFIPKVFQGASQEKLRHIHELINYENKWGQSNSKVIAIHGNADRIVPYENSLYLLDVLDKKKFDLITLENGRHDLIWTNFEMIKKEILKMIID